MKVALVVHNFLPNHAAGTEVYTLQLGQELRKRGHELVVFTVEKDISLADLSLRTREFGGLRVVELINNLFYDDFRDTWDHARIAECFARFLEQEKPDVVHFQHLWYLSAGCVEAAARLYVPVLFTLHDYWLQCPRFGQRVHANGSICHTIDFVRCGDCLSSFKFAQTKAERGVANLIARVKASVGIDLTRAARAAERVRATWRNPESGVAMPDPARSSELAELARVRDRELRERVVPHVHRFLSPSHFLRERFIEWGIPEERIQFLRTGIDLARFGGLERTRNQRLRVAFVGTLAPHKAPHLLLEAWQRLAPDLRERAQLEIYGPRQHNPRYVAELERLAANAGAELRGSLARNDVPRELCRIDLLVVPSIWYENSPLVIVEGIATRTPMLVSDLGGMAELVRPGANGYLFKVGDVEDLARMLARLIGERELLDGLYKPPEPIKSVQRDAEQIEELYFQAIDALRVKRLVSKA